MSDAKHIDPKCVTSEEAWAGIAGYAMGYAVALRGLEGYPDAESHLTASLMAIMQGTVMPGEGRVLARFRAANEIARNALAGNAPLDKEEQYG